MMYEELIKDLRENHGKYFARDMEAADAIEEEDMAFRHLERDYKELCAHLPKWIPVTERLPEDEEFVLVCNDDGLMMIAKHETETYEWYYKYTNYDFDIWENEEQGPVCYWMPLPEPPAPPKEGE
jgi:hypothetical protein